MRRYGGWHGLGQMTSFKKAASLWLMMICLVTAEEYTASLDSESSEKTSREFFGPQPVLSINPDSEDRSQPVNFVHLAGTTAQFDCEVDMHLGGNVAWLYRNLKSEYWAILTLKTFSVSNNRRIFFSFNYPNNFRLGIKHVSSSDEGLYKCQVLTTEEPKTPKDVKQVFLKVIAPDVVITDQRNRVVTERYYKVGSVVHLTCLASHVDTTLAKITWCRDDLPIQEGVSYISNLKPGSIESTLVLHDAQQHHSGDYTCRVNNLVSASVPVHVLPELRRVYHYDSSPNATSSHTP